MYVNLFKNTKKEKDNQPDWRLTMKSGEEFIDVGGGWNKESKTGVKFVSLKLDDEKILEQLGTAQIEKSDKVNLDSIPF